MNETRDVRLPPTRRRRPNRGPLILAILVVAVALAFAFWRLSGPDDGIEFGKIYSLAMTYKVNIKEKGGTVPGRVFDFTDRSLPKPSILIPLSDSRGVPIVQLNTGLAPGTIRKMQGEVRESKVEGTTYPAYKYVKWEFNWGTIENQMHIPTVVPDRR